MKDKKIKIYAIVVTIFFILATIAFGMVFFRENYPQRIAVRMGWIDNDENREINYAVRGWNNTFLVIVSLHKVILESISLKKR